MKELFRNINQKVKAVDFPDEVLIAADLMVDSELIDAEPCSKWKKRCRK
jgi:hypothetical protein